MFRVGSDHDLLIQAAPPNTKFAPLARHRKKNLVKKERREEGSPVKSFELLTQWPVSSVAAGVLTSDGHRQYHGPSNERFALASITKLFTAVTVLIAHEEGSVDIDAHLDGGYTLRDLLSHSSGLSAQGAVMDKPGQRRIYSNAAYEKAALVVATQTGFDFVDYMTAAIFEPLSMSNSMLLGSPAFGAVSSTSDILSFIESLGSLLSQEMISEMVSPQVSSLVGVLPGYGRQDPNTWGAGPEIRSDKAPHWTGSLNSPATWGHFGQAGTFVWHDPELEVTTVVLTNKPFGDWAKPLWPAFSDAVIAELA